MECLKSCLLEQTDKTFSEVTLKVHICTIIQTFLVITFKVHILIYKPSYHVDCTSSSTPVEDVLRN